MAQERGKRKLRKKDKEVWKENKRNDKKGWNEKKRSNKKG